ncbi:MAG: siderophore-interacting protein [Pseudomonadota bacterium]|nr:siderophore-interacting protein [Pseudomonadota bacterium]
MQGLCARFREFGVVSGRSVFARDGCEFCAFVAIRRHFRKEPRLAREDHRAAAYWRRCLAGDDAGKAN